MCERIYIYIGKAIEKVKTLPRAVEFPMFWIHPFSGFKMTGRRKRKSS